MIDQFARLPPEGLLLDGIRFMPEQHERESAHCGGNVIGELDWDDIKLRWQARSGDGPWVAMRSRAEARAFVVTKYLFGRTLLRCWQAPENAA